jgi:hypothetical protein
MPTKREIRNRFIATTFDLVDEEYAFERSDEFIIAIVCARAKATHEEVVNALAATAEEDAGKD